MVDYSKFFGNEDRLKLITMYHKYDNNKQNLWSQEKLLGDINKEFNIYIPDSDAEAIRSWFKRVRCDLDPSYPSPSLSVFNDEKLALEAERVKLRDQRNALKATIREQSRFEYISECINNAALEVAKQKPLKWQQPISGGRKEAALLLSDWHVGLQVDSVFNKYDVEECRRRLGVLTQKVIQYGREHKVKVVHVFDLGDAIAGTIHNAVRVSSNEDVISQVMIACELFAEVIGALANEFAEVRFNSVTDNHSRILPNKNDVLQKESYARCIPWYLKPRLAHMKNVTVMDSTLDHEICVTDIMGHTVFAVHGHRDNVNNVVSNLALMLKQFPQYVFLAHYHHNVEEEFHGCEVVVNPSLVGVEEHSKGIRKTSRPAQKMMIFSEDGRECTYNIRVTESK